MSFPTKPTYRFARENLVPWMIDLGMVRDNENVVQSCRFGVCLQVQTTEFATKVIAHYGFPWNVDELAEQFGFIAKREQWAKESYAQNVGGVSMARWWDSFMWSYFPEPDPEPVVVKPPKAKNESETVW